MFRCGIPLRWSGAGADERSAEITTASIEYPPRGQPLGHDACVSRWPPEGSAWRNAPRPFRLLSIFLFIVGIASFVAHMATGRVWFDLTAWAALATVFAITVRFGPLGTKAGDGHHVKPSADGKGK